MVEFEVTSKEACLIDGIGEFEPGETKVVGPVEAAAFRAAHGYPLGEANFPPMITLSTNLVDKEEETPEDEGGE